MERRQCTTLLSEGSHLAALRCLLGTLRNAVLRFLPPSCSTKLLDLTESILRPCCITARYARQGREEAKPKHLGGST